MRLRLLAVLLMVSAVAAASAADMDTLWKIGESDNSARELALAPDGYSKFLSHRDFKSLDELYEGAVRVFDISEVPVGVAHVKVFTAVTHKVVSELQGGFMYLVHVPYIKAEVDESGVAPPSSLKSLSPFDVQILYKFDM